MARNTTSMDIHLYQGHSLVEDTPPTNFYPICVTGESVSSTHAYSVPEDECSDGSRDPSLGTHVGTTTGGEVSWTLRPTNWTANFLEAVMFDAAPLAVHDVAANANLTLRTGAWGSDTDERLFRIDDATPDAFTGSVVANDLLILQSASDPSKVLPTFVTRITSTQSYTAANTLDNAWVTQTPGDIRFIRPEKYSLKNDDVYTWLLKDITNITEGLTYKNLSVASATISASQGNNVTASVTYQGGKRVTSKDVLASTSQTVGTATDGNVWAPAPHSSTLFITDRVYDPLADGAVDPDDAPIPFEDDSNGPMIPLSACVRSVTVNINNSLSDITCMNDVETSGVYAGNAEVSIEFEALVTKESYATFMHQSAENRPIGIAWVIANYDDTSTGTTGLGFVIPNGYLSLSGDPTKSGELVSVTGTVVGAKTSTGGSALNIYRIPAL